MAALLFRSELVFEVNAGRARLDIGFHDLKAVERAAEARLGIGENRHEPVALRSALHMLDLVGAGEGAVDLLRQLRPTVGGVERLVGVHRPRCVAVGGDLPAGQIDGVEPGADHLHRLVAAERAERAHRLVLPEQVPQFERAAPGERMLDWDRSAQLQYVLDAVRPLDILKPTLGSRHHLTEIAHYAFPCSTRAEGNPSGW